VRRWLAADALKPWQHRSWISIRDPDFAVKAARVLDLYAGVWDGEPLGDNDFVVCADEKTSIQARCRCHPKRSGPGSFRSGSAVPAGTALTSSTISVATAPKRSCPNTNSSSRVT